MLKKYKSSAWLIILDRNYVLQALFSILAIPEDSQYSDSKNMQTESDSMAYNAQSSQNPGKPRKPEANGEDC